MITSWHIVLFCCHVFWLKNWQKNAHGYKTHCFGSESHRTCRTELTQIFQILKKKEKTNKVNRTTYSFFCPHRRKRQIFWNSAWSQSASPCEWELPWYFLFRWQRCRRQIRVWSWRCCCCKCRASSRTPCRARHTGRGCEAIPKRARV